MGRIRGIRGKSGLKGASVAFAIAFGWVCLVIAGCVSTRLQLVDLPERPIAFVYWAGKDGQKRAEIFEKAAEMQNPPTDGDDPERMEEMQIRAYLRGDETLPMRSQLAKYPGRLMLVWPQTGELERVEAAPVDAIPIDWSPDGKRLLIASGHRGGKEQLYEYHLDRRDLSPVTRGPFEHSRGGYDESGRLLVNQIERVRSQGVSANTVHWLRSGGRLGITLGDEVPPGTLRVAPAGDKIVYEQVRPRPRRNGPTILESMIAVRSVEVNSEEAVLIKGREPTLTPDGQWIVFASRSSAGYRLRRMRLDGSSRVAIGPGGTAERMPSVSPDGNFIAFVQSRSGRRRLAVRRFDGKDERILVSSGWCEFPVW